MNEMRWLEIENRRKELNNEYHYNSIITNLFIVVLAVVTAELKPLTANRKSKAKHIEIEKNIFTRNAGKR